MWMLKKSIRESHTLHTAIPYSHYSWPVVHTIDQIGTRNHNITNNAFITHKICFIYDFLLSCRFFLRLLLLLPLLLLLLLLLVCVCVWVSIAFNRSVRCFARVTLPQLFEICLELAICWTILYELMLNTQFHLLHTTIATLSKSNGFVFRWCFHHFGHRREHGGGEMHLIFFTMLRTMQTTIIGTNNANAVFFALSLALSLEVPTRWWLQFVSYVHLPCLKNININNQPNKLDNGKLVPMCNFNLVQGIFSVVSK